MSKQKDRLDLATKYIVDDPDRPTIDLDKAERKTVEHLRLCYNYINENPLATHKELRDQIMKLCSVTDIAAYRYISLIQMLIGEQSLEGKNFAKMKVAALLDEEYICLKNENYAAATARHKLIQDYIKAFRLDIDEGEMLNAAKYLKIEAIQITTDPASLGIHRSPKEIAETERIMKKYGMDEEEESCFDCKPPTRKEIDEMMRRYGIEDAKFENVESVADDSEPTLLPPLPEL